MPKYTETSQVVDGILKILAVGTLTVTALLAPNAVQLFDKPMRKYFDKLDKKAQDREMKRIIYYMGRQNLIADNYEYGLQLTDKARKRLQKIDIENLTIPLPPTWSRKWYISFYDIPEKHKVGRDALTAKLRRLGCYQLQKSVWIYPHPYEETLMTLASHYDLAQYITYIETTYIANEQTLLKHFSEISSRI